MWQRGLQRNLERKTGYDEGKYISLIAEKVKISLHHICSFLLDSLASWQIEGNLDSKRGIFALFPSYNRPSSYWISLTFFHLIKLMGWPLFNCKKLHPCPPFPFGISSSVETEPVKCQEARSGVFKVFLRCSSLCPLLIKCRDASVTEHLFHHFVVVEDLPWGSERDKFSCSSQSSFVFVLSALERLEECASS